MQRTAPKRTVKAPGDAAFGTRARKPVPFAFVLDAIAELSPRTRPMFGCLAVYVGEKIVFILREKGGDADTGVWVATVAEHHASLRKELPSMRSISVLGGDVTGWQNIPADAEDFEELAMRACELALKGDPRIGKIPKGRKPRKARD